MNGRENAELQIAQQLEEMQRRERPGRDTTESFPTNRKPMDRVYNETRDDAQRRLLSVHQI